MHRVCRLEIKVHHLYITAFLCCFLFDPSLTSARNQIQMVSAFILISNFDKHCEGANCLDAQEPFEWFHGAISGCSVLMMFSLLLKDV